MEPDQLFLATLNGRVDDVVVLLENGDEVDRPLYYGSGAIEGKVVTALMVAAQEGHADVVKVLLERKANVDLSRSDDATPLFIASMQGHPEVVELLIAANATLHLDDEAGISPLIIACNNGHEQVVRALLAANAPVEQDDPNGRTPLYYACQAGRAEFVRILLAADASVDQAAASTTPLWVASTQGHAEVVSLLLAASANVNLADGRGVKPLHPACAQGHIEVATMLLDANAEVDTVDRNGFTPLIAASQAGRTEVVAKLLAANAKVNHADREGLTPLIVASQKGRTEVVVKLIAANAEVDHAECNGETPLWLACEFGHAEVVRELLTAGASVNHANKKSVTPLWIASKKGHLEIVQRLSSYGASRTFVYHGMELTAEGVASDNGQIRIKAWLAMTFHWTTSLHHAASCQCQAFVTPAHARGLLRGGADVYAAARSGGPTPHSLAKATETVGGAEEGTPSFLILEAAKPWSRKTHDLFPAPARARAVELMLIGELLSRESRFEAYGPQAVVDAWMTFVVPQAVSRNHVQVLGLKGRADLNGHKGTIGEFNEAKGRYPVTLETGESVLIKTMNLVTI